MSITYNITTNFAAKDSLPANDPDKVVRGSEFTTEFDAIKAAFDLATPLASPPFTGTPTVNGVQLIALVQAAPTWNFAAIVGGGSAEQPDQTTYTSGTNVLRASLTWGTTGGASGNVTQSVWEFSSNSGSSYSSVGTESITYDASGNVTATTWS